MKIQVEITGQSFKHAGLRVRNSFRNVIYTLKTKKIGVVDRDCKIVAK